RWAMAYRPQERPALAPIRKSIETAMNVPRALSSFFASPTVKLSTRVAKSLVAGSSSFRSPWSSGPEGACGGRGNVVSSIGSSCVGGIEAPKTGAQPAPLGRALRFRGDRVRAGVRKRQRREPPQRVCRGAPCGDARVLDSALGGEPD